MSFLRPDEKAHRSTDVPLPVCNAISSRSAVVAAPAPTTID
jgi:hypothetical protein